MAGDEARQWGVNPTTPGSRGELFVEVQRALQRARAERAKAELRSTGVGVTERDPSQSLSRSPAAGVRRAQVGEATAAAAKPDISGVVHTSGDARGSNGFFEDEMRGYRLLKASRLSQAERQHVMTLTRKARTSI